MQGRMMFVHALTPVHTGIGQSVDVIDLPVAREKPTNWPYIPGSSIKGVLRDTYTGVLAADEITELFGPEKIEGDDSAAGSVLFSDGHIICMPVRSFYGTFAWVTCPSALARLRRDFTCASGNCPLPAWDGNPDFEHAAVCDDSVVVHDGTMYLEDLDVHAATDGSLSALAGALGGLVFTSDTEVQSFVRRFAVVNDDLFTTLTETATEVVARVKIKDDTKTVQTGGLWYEESVPAESIFWSAVMAAPRNGKSTDQVLGMLAGKWVETVQIGGHAGVGRGICRVVMGKEA